MSESPSPAAPATKAARHALIAQILTKERIRSQAELRGALAARGVSTTQATLSRDLVELRATKLRSAGGAQVYAIPEAGAPGQVNTGAVGGDESLADHTTPRLARCRSSPFGVFLWIKIYKISLSGIYFFFFIDNDFANFFLIKRSFYACSW